MANPTQIEIAFARTQIRRHVEDGECPKCGYDQVIVYDFIPQVLKDIGEFSTNFRCGDPDCGRFFHNHPRRP